MIYLDTIARLRHFARDERGTATVEFVLWTPLLFMLLAGSFVYFDLFRASSKAVKATHTLGDIVARQTSVDAAFLNDLLPILDASVHVNGTGKWLRVTSIRYDADADTPYQVLWSHVTDGGTPLGDDDIPLTIMPALADEDTVILTETNIPFTPVGGRMFGFGEVEYTSRLTFRPRFIQSIPLT